MSNETASEGLNYLADSGFFLYKLEWLDRDNIIGMMCQNEMKCDGTDIGRIILWNKNTKYQRLIFEGKEMGGLMPEGVVLGKNGNIYAFDANACIIINKESLKVNDIVFPKEKAGGFSPSIYGDLIFRADHGMGLVKHEDYSKTVILKEDQAGVTDSGYKYTIFYETPQWSPDGKWIAFYKMAADFIIPPQVSIIAGDGTNEKNFKFDTASGFAWSPDSEHLVLINDGSIFEGPPEIRIENIITGEEILVVFDEPIDGQKIQFLEIMDIFESKILLQAYFDFNGVHARPVLLYDWKTMEKKWLTSLDNVSVSAAFSPDGKTVAITSSEEAIENRIVLVAID